MFEIRSTNDPIRTIVRFIERNRAEAYVKEWKIKADRYDLFVTEV